MELLIAIGAGCIWQGLQIVWVAPGAPAPFARGRQPLERGSAAAFQRFWLDQYAWIGIVLTVAGTGLVTWGALS